MGYDYRAGPRTPVGSVAPIGGPTLRHPRHRDEPTSAASRRPRSSSACPYYGRAWSTDRRPLHAQEHLGHQVRRLGVRRLRHRPPFAVDHGKSVGPGRRRRPGPPTGARTARPPTAASTPWRQLYFDDATALKAKYDLVNRTDLRGVGIWALGYDGTRTELYEALKDKFITDKVPPVIAAHRSRAARSSRRTATAAIDTSTVRPSGHRAHLTFGWLVAAVSRDGVAGTDGPVGASTGKTVAFTWDGRDSAGTPGRRTGPTGSPSGRPTPRTIGPRSRRS